MLQNFDKEYTVTNPINVGDDCHFDIGRGDDVPLILMGRVEEVEPESTPVENYIRVRGRCWGEKIFRRVVTKTYENKKGEEIIRDLIDYYVGLSHTRENSALTSDAASGQKDCVVADASIFSVGDLVKIQDDNAWEYNEVSAIDPVTDTLTMVNNLANTYTVLANGKVWIDLIEKTDTTYTLLEYEDAKVFDILKYLAESADKSGVIGYDFRVEYDGKFAFFPKNSKTSSISLSEKIEHSRYSEDIHRVRNKIMVYGAAEKPYPLDTDGQPWSDSLTEDLTKPDNYLQHADGGWEPLIPAHETVSIETATVHTGSKSVKIESTSYDYYMGIHFTFDSDKYVNGNSYPKLCFTLREDNKHNKKITVGLTDKDRNDCWQTINVSNYDEWQSYQLGIGKQNQEAWTLGYGTFDWENIREIRFDFHQNPSQHGAAHIDRLHFGGCRWSATEEDSSSQSSYGLRELTETDEELHSNHECSLRGKALLNHLSQPAEFLTLRTTCLDYGNDRLLPGDKIHVILPNENIDSDFRIISVEYRVSAREQTLEITLELGKEKPLLADYLYGLRSTTVTVEKLMRTKAGQSGIIGSGGSGGGGGGSGGGADEKVKVSSDDTTTDFLLQKLLAGTGITLSENNPGGNEKVKIDGHREWGWADEQCGKHHISIPYCYYRSWIEDQKVISKGSSGEWDDDLVSHPNVLYLPEVDPTNPYKIYYSGRADPGWPTNAKIGLAYSSDGIAFIKHASNPIIPSYPTGYQSMNVPSVVYDEYESDPNKRWKLICQAYHTSDAQWYLLVYYSSDGVSWTYWKKPPQPTNFNDSQPQTIRLGNAFFILYRDSSTGELRLCVYDKDFSNVYNHGVVLTTGAAGAWDDTAVSEASFYYNLGIFYILYTGRNSSNYLHGGLAMSGGNRPGFDYTKYPLNPVTPDYNVSWGGCIMPAMIMTEENFVMYCALRKAAGAALEIYRFKLV